MLLQFEELDNQTVSFDVFNGLSVVMSKVVFTTRALPGFPLMHNETGASMAEISKCEQG